MRSSSRSTAALENYKPMTSRLTSNQKAVLLVGAVAFVVFLPSVATGFVFDDRLLISENEFVHSWAWFPRAFTTHFWSITRGFDVVEVRRYYRPFVTVSYLVTWMIAGGRPWVFHLTNVVLHALTAGLATRAALRWTGSRPCAVALGLLFAIHPSRTENVTWVSGRTDVLMMLFVLCALEAFARHEELRTSSSRRAPIAFGAGLACVVAAVLSKEPAAVTPLLLLAEGASPDHARSPVRSRLPLVATTALCAAYVIARSMLLPTEVDVVRTYTPVHALLSIGAYIQRAVVPWPPAMYYHALAYDDAGPVYPLPLVVLGAIATMVMLIALATAWRRSKRAFFLLVAAAAFMGPLLNVYFTGLNVSAQDRFLYAPLLCASSGLVVLFRDRAAHLAGRRAACLTLTGLAFAWALMIAIRTPDYRDDETLWASELRHNPLYPYPLQMLAQAAARRGDLATSYEYFRRADAPASRKYQLTRTGGAHFQQAFVLAATFPDGRARELRLLLAETWRLVDPGATPPPTAVLGYDVGGPIANLEHDAKDKRLYWDVALLATRVGDLGRAEEAVRRSSSDALLSSANPLNGALALARIGHLADARALVSEIRRRPQELGALVPPRDLANFEARLERAERIAEGRDQATIEIDRTVAESMRLAELGAYFAALRTLHNAGVIDQPELTPLVLQLLMACRLEAAAQERARRDLPDDGDLAIARLRATLPPRLRETDAVPGNLKRLLASASEAPR